MDLIGDFLACNPDVAIALLTAHGSDELRDAVMRIGAKHLLKTLEIGRIHIVRIREGGAGNRA